MNPGHHHAPRYYASSIVHTQPLHQQRVITRRPIVPPSIPQFNLSRLPQIPVVIPPSNGIIPPNLGLHNLHHSRDNMIGPILSQSTTNNYDLTHCIPSIPSLPSNIAQSLPNISYIEPRRSANQPAPPKPPSPTKSVKSTATTATSATNSHKSSRKRSISETKDPALDPMNNLHCKRRKVEHNQIEDIKKVRGTATNRVWRQTRQNAKFRMAISVLDGFRSDHGGKLPSLRAIMKMLKVGFPKAHEILDEYAKHVGCSKDKLVEDMTIRQEKKNKNDEDGNRKKRMNRNIFEYPINVNGKLQEIILNLFHQKKVGNIVGSNEMYNKMEKSLTEFEGFYSKFGLNDKLRLAQSYFILSSRYFYDFHNYNQSYEFVEKALTTFRDCNYLAQPNIYNINISSLNNVNNEDIGPFWAQIFEVYMLCAHILLDNTQYYDAKRIYLCAFELVKYMEAPPQTICIALESLSHCSKLQLQTNECCDYTRSIIKILSKKEDNMVNTIDNEMVNTNDIKLINVRAYYSCILSLHCFELGNDDTKAMQILNNVTKECRDKFGDRHQITFAIYLYFALHFVNIEKFDLAFNHIEYVMNERSLNRKERLLFEDVTNGFNDKLLSFNNNDDVFNNNELKLNCLKLFEYQLLMKDINEKEEKEEKDIKQETKIKKERKMDKNDLILNQQIALLFYKFRDYDRVQHAMNDLENNLSILKPHQIEKLKEIKKEMNLNENNHEMHCDFNVLPNFLPVTAPKSMS